MSSDVKAGKLWAGQHQEAEAEQAADGFSVPCLSYDDQCLLPALPEVQVITKPNYKAKKVTLKDPCHPGYWVAGALDLEFLSESSEISPCSFSGGCFANSMVLLYLGLERWAVRTVLGRIGDVALNLVLVI